MTHRPRMSFKVPVAGESVTLSARLGMMSDYKIGPHSFLVESEFSPTIPLAKHRQLLDCLAFLNALIDSGMPWSVLATGKNDNGLIGAVIEAADNRLQETRSGPDAT